MKASRKWRPARAARAARERVDYGLSDGRRVIGGPAALMRGEGILDDTERTGRTERERA